MDRESTPKHTDPNTFKNESTGEIHEGESYCHSVERGRQQNALKHTLKLGQQMDCSVHISQTTFPSAGALNNGDQTGHRTKSPAGVIPRGCH